MEPSRSATSSITPPRHELTDFTIEPGDCLVLYSDGVTDAQNGADEEFGESRSIDLLRQSAGEPADIVIECVFDAIDAFVGDAPNSTTSRCSCSGGSDG